MTPETDIVICVRSTAQYPTINYFEQCVDTVCRHTQKFRFIFVDDNSDRDHAEAISQIANRFNSAIFIRTHFQHWFTRAVNLGLRMIRTPYCITLNSDCVVDNNWLEELYAVKNEVEASVGRVGLVGSVFSEPEQRRYMLSVGEDYVTGHCWLLSMAAITEASNQRGQPGIYLDETRADAIHIRSDVFISRQLVSLGWTCVKSFKSAVGHHGCKSWGGGAGLHRVQTLRLDDVSYKY